MKKEAMALWYCELSLHQLGSRLTVYPDGQHTLAFYIKCVPPVGRGEVVQLGMGGGVYTSSELLCVVVQLSVLVNQKFRQCR